MMIGVNQAMYRLHLTITSDGKSSRLLMASMEDCGESHLKNLETKKVILDDHFKHYQIDRFSCFIHSSSVDRAIGQSCPFEKFKQDDP